MFDPFFCFLGLSHVTEGLIGWYTVPFIIKMVKQIKLFETQS